MRSPTPRRDALELAARALKGKVDKAGEPLIRHAYRVGMALGRDHRTADGLVAGFLHDVIEDGGLTADDLLAAGVSPAAVRAVSIVSRRPGETYQDFIHRIRASGDALAIDLKIRDIRDHLGRPDSLPLSLARRYAIALEILTS